MEKSNFTKLIVLLTATLIMACPLSDIGKIAGKWRYDDPDKITSYVILEIIAEDSTFVLTEYENNIKVNTITGDVKLEDGALSFKTASESEEDSGEFSQGPTITLKKDILSFGGVGFKKVTE
ncbi:MAG: hypothetical protein JXR63_11105 [Spirochaetales bacterium]|nr:hypothetical protein [Spirochaetales bacterium]